MRGSYSNPPSPRRRGSRVHNPPRTVPSGRSGRPPAPAAPGVPPGGQAVRRHRVPGRSAPRTAASRAQPQNLRPCADRVSTCRPAPRREYPAWRPKPRPAWHVSSTSRPPHASRCRAPRRRSSRPYATPPRPCRNRNRVSWCGYSSPPSTADPPSPRPPSAANTP